MTDSIDAGKDCQEELAGRIADAIASAVPLSIRGGATKAFLGSPSRPGLELDTRQHNGVILYEPGELVVQARCGTRITELNALLKDRKQMLAFEPPLFGRDATVGGMIATGLSGPARPFRGAVRDNVLGVSMIRGDASQVRFGGRVIKNVAGYDLSRLMTGSFGTLGLMLDVTLRVVPRPQFEQTRVLECSREEGLALMLKHRRSNLPLSACAWVDGRLYLRASGHRATLRTALRVMGGEKLAAKERFWSKLRELRLEWFNRELDLWRVSVAPGAPLDHPEECVIDWCGAQRWYHLDDADKAHDIARAGGGHATLFWSQGNMLDRFSPLQEEIRQIHHRLKERFDPHRVFNPGRMYSDL